MVTMATKKNNMVTPVFYSSNVFRLLKFPLCGLCGLFIRFLFPVFKIWNAIVSLYNASIGSTGPTLWRRHWRENVYMDIKLLVLSVFLKICTSLNRISLAVCRLSQASRNDFEFEYISKHTGKILYVATLLSAYFSITWRDVIEAVGRPTDSSSMLLTFL